MGDNLQVSIQFIIQQAGEVRDALNNLLQGLQAAGAKQVQVAEQLVAADQKAADARSASDQKLLQSRVNTYNQIEALYQKQHAALQAQIDKDNAAQEAAAAKQVAIEQAKFEKELQAQIAADNRKQQEAARIYAAMQADEAKAAGANGNNTFLASLSKSLVGLTLLRQAIREVEAVVKEAFGNFEEYEKGLARISAIVPLNTEQTAAFSKALLDLSTTLPVSINEIQAAAEAYIRAGGDVKNATAFVEQAGKLAVGTQSSMKASTELVIDTMKNYGVEMTRQGEITDFFAKLAQTSRTDLDQLQNTFGRLTIVAANSGVSLQELGAAFAQMRESGLTSQQASVALEQAIQRLQDPTAKIRDQLKEWGVTATDLKGKLEQLKAANLTEGDLLEVFGARTGVRAIQPLLNGLDDMKRKEIELTNATGETSRAFGAQAETTEAKIQLMKNAWQGFTDQALSSLSVVLRPLFDLLGGIARGLEDLPAPLSALVVGLGGVEAAGLGVVLMLKSLGVTITVGLGPLGLILGAVGLLAGGIAYLAGEEEREAASRAKMTNALIGDAERLNSLAENYRTVAAEVAKATKGSDDEADAKKRLKAITDKLIEIHPEYKNALDNENVSLTEQLKLIDGIVDAQKEKIRAQVAALEAQKATLQQDEAALEKAKEHNNFTNATNIIGRGYFKTAETEIPIVQGQIQDLDKQMAALNSQLDSLSGKATEGGVAIKAVGEGGESSKEKVKHLRTEMDMQIRALQDEIEVLPRRTTEEQAQVKVMELKLKMLREINQTEKDYAAGTITAAEREKEIAGHEKAFAQAKQTIEDEAHEKEKESIQKVLSEIESRENESFGKRRAALETYYEHRRQELKKAGATEQEQAQFNAAYEIAKENEAHDELLKSKQIYQKRLKEIEDSTGEKLSIDQQIDLLDKLAKQGVITAAAMDELTEKLNRQKDAAAGWAAGWHDAAVNFDNQFKYMHDEAIKMSNGIESAVQKSVRAMVLESGTGSDKVKAFFKDMASATIGNLLDMGVHQLTYSAIHSKSIQKQQTETTTQQVAETSGNRAVAVSAQMVTGANTAKAAASSLAAEGAAEEVSALTTLTAANDTAAVSAQVAAAATYFETYAGIPFVGPVIAAAYVAAMEVEMSALMASASSIVGFADGAIVNKPTLAMVGEGNEPEAIVPKSALRSFMNDISRTSVWAKNPQPSLPDTGGSASGESIMGSGSAPLNLTLSIPHGVFMDTSRRGKAEFVDFLADGIASALGGRLGRKVVGQSLKSGA